MAGSKYTGLMHATDVYPTLVTAAGLGDVGSTGPVPPDGLDVWAALRSNGTSPRTEILYTPLVDGLNPEDCTEDITGSRTSWGQACGAALRVGDYKLVVGYPGDSRALALPNASASSAVTPLLNQSGGGPGLDGCNYTSGVGCPCHHMNGGPCLYDVVADPGESRDLSKVRRPHMAAERRATSLRDPTLSSDRLLSQDPAHADTLAKIHKRLTELSATHQPQAGLSGDALDHDEQLKCAQFAQTKCFEPYAPAVAWPHDGSRKDEL